MTSLSLRVGDGGDPLLPRCPPRSSSGIAIYRRWAAAAAVREEANLLSTQGLLLEAMPSAAWAPKGTVTGKGACGVAVGFSRAAFEPGWEARGDRPWGPAAA